MQLGANGYYDMPTRKWQIEKPIESVIRKVPLILEKCTIRKTFLLKWGDWGNSLLLPPMRDKSPSNPFEYPDCEMG